MQNCRILNGSHVLILQKSSTRQDILLSRRSWRTLAYYCMFRRSWESENPLAIQPYQRRMVSGFVFSRLSSHDIQKYLSRAPSSVSLLFHCTLHPPGSKDTASRGTHDGGAREGGIRGGSPDAAVPGTRGRGRGRQRQRQRQRQRPWGRVRARRHRPSRRRGHRGPGVRLRRAPHPGP